MIVNFKELFRPTKDNEDWSPSKNKIFVKSFRVMRRDWTQTDNIIIQNNEILIFKHNNTDTYIMGQFGDEGFDTVFHIEFRKRDDISSQFNAYGNVYNVDGVYVKDTMRGTGYATEFYRYFVDKGNVILGDEIQYYGARLLWAKLSKMDDLVVDVIDIDAGKVIDKDITLHHGEADYEFDETLCDYSDIKKHIRLVLTKVL